MKMWCTGTTGPEEEDEYWRSSGMMREALRASDAGRDGSDVPLVRYYTPKLLPAYRDHDEVEEDPEAREVYVAPRAFCKWHRMVFRGPVSLSPSGSYLRVDVSMGWALCRCTRR